MSKLLSLKSIYLLDKLEFLLLNVASNLVIGLSLIAYNSFYPNGAWDILLLLDFILVFISEGIIKLKGLCKTWFTEEGFLEGFLCLDSF